jgi:hypothetical protein
MTPPHLDDETISALYDGELPTGDAAAARVHLGGCSTCRARLDAFANVAAAVTAPAACPAEARDAAVATALDAVSRVSARHERNWAPVLAVAALLVLVALAVPLLGMLDSGDDADETAAGGARDRTALESAAGDAAPLADLGAVDAGNLASVVGDRVAAQAAGTFAAPAPAPAMTGEDADRAAGGAGGGDATAAPGSAAGGAATFDRARACAPELGAEGDQILVARAAWENRPAAVLVYRVGADLTAYVVDPGDCRILHFSRFRAPS